MSAISQRDWQDQEDGRALRELREAVPDGWFSVGWMPGPNGWRWEVVASRTAVPPMPAPGISVGQSLVAAADKAREALR